MQSRESPDSRPWDVGISGEVFQPGLILNTVYHLRIKGVGKGGGVVQHLSFSVNGRASLDRGSYLRGRRVGT